MALDEAPPFWWTKASWQAWGLALPAWFWGRVSSRRMQLPASHSVNVPVVCVGNFIAGGAGKTPTVIALAKHAKKMGYQPGILSRGHGGGVNRPTVVDPEKHDARDVGDEPLLLAQTATTVVTPNRPQGAELLVENGCTIIFMDDGFQNPALKKDFTIAVVDSKRGIGNGFVHPAGPMRVPLRAQMPLADAVLIIGDGDGADRVVRVAAKHAKPVETATIVLKGAKRFKNLSVLAYAGIADPDKFFAGLQNAGAAIMDRSAFGDHHHFHKEEMQELLARARLKKLQLVTTAKDHVRLPLNSEAGKALAEASDIAHIDLKFDDPNFAARIIRKAAEKSTTG